MTRHQHAPSTVTITLSQDAYGNLTASTDLAAPTIGAPLTPVQSLGLQIVSQLHHVGVPLAHGAKHVPALGMLLDLASPDQYAWIVPADVGAAVRSVLHRSQHFAPSYGTAFANGSLA